MSADAPATEEASHAWRRLFQGGGLDVETVLADLARVGMLGVTTHAPGDPHMSAFNEGKRALALYIMGHAGVPIGGG